MQDKQPNSSFLITDFIALENGSIAELIEDPCNPQETTFAVFDGGIIRYEKTLTVGGRTLVPYSRDEKFIKHVRLARGVEPYGSAKELFTRVLVILTACVDLDEESLHLLAFFILGTWLIDRLPIAPYLALIGRARSGKTTTIRTLNLLCRRSLLTADISSAAFYSACESLTPTLLIDETATAGDRRTLYHLLRAGSTPDSIALRRRESLRCFGAKVLTWTELPNDIALNTRCIIVAMRESHRNDLFRPNDPRIVAATESLQRALLQYRLEMFSTLTAPAVPSGKPWYSRNRDLYQALALPVSLDSELLTLLASAFEEQELLTREALSPRQLAVFQVLAIAIHLQPTPPVAHSIKKLTESTNLMLASLGEQFRMSEREVGAVLLSLGVANRKRTNTGWVLLFDQKLREYVHELAAAHGVNLESFREKRGEKCELCDQLTNERTEEKFTSDGNSAAATPLPPDPEHRVQ